MKIKIFNCALCFMLSAASGVLAQQKQSKQEPAAPAAPAEELAPFDLYTLKAPMASGDFTPLLNLSQDTSYHKEMRKLQEQMNDLRKKMSSLRVEELKKNSIAMQEMSKKMSKSFDFKFKDDMIGDGKTMNFNSEGSNFSFNKGDDYIKKKIESGEVREKIKSYTKTYNLDKDDKIMIDNRYGKINVNTWDKKEVKVEVQIKADADEESDAQKLLDGVTIDDSKSESTVSFKTNIENTKNGNTNFMRTWLNSGKTHVRKLEVNYTVYMPAKSTLIISNKFGSIKMPDLNGKVTLNLSYGNLIAQQLTNPLNEVTLKFGDGTIETLNGQMLNLSYGKLSVGTADNLKAKLSFSGLSVDKLKSAGDISIKYGNGFKVGELDHNVKNLNVDATFTKVLLNVKDDFDFDVSTKMGTFYYEDAPVSISSTSPGEGEHSFSTTKTYKGRVGKGNSDKTITIKSSFSSVKFDKTTPN